ncbi:hypothetical protein [Sphingobium yanoikuyae]|nr:hypothetical protein [Sphingobium yanoikuyae]
MKRAYPYRNRNGRRHAAFQLPNGSHRHGRDRPLEGPAALVDIAQPP